MFVLDKSGLLWYKKRKLAIRLGAFNGPMLGRNRGGARPGPNLR
jgi:hypothetical protein